MSISPCLHSFNNNHNLTNLDLTQRIKCLEETAKYAPFETAISFSNLAVQDDKIAFRIAKICLEARPEIFLDIIHYFNVRDQALLRKLAFRCVQLIPEKVAYQIDKFNIQSEDVRCELLKILIPYLSYGSFANLAITKDANIYSIVKYCIKKYPEWFDGLYYHIKVKNERLRFVLFKMRIKRSIYEHTYIPEDFYIFHIESTSLLIQTCFFLIKHQIFSNYRQVLIKLLNISESDRSIIAQKCAQSGSMLADTFSHFKFSMQFISDNQAIFEKMAITSARNPHNKLSSIIDQFYLKNEATRIKLAKLCAVHCDHFAKDYSLFEIRSPKAHYQIALLCVYYQPTCFTQYFKSFQITDQFQINTLAFMAAKNDPEFMLYHDYFGISDEGILFKLYKSASHNLALYAKRIKINCSEKRFELALRCALHDPSFSTNFPDFNLQISSKRLFLLAWTAARSFPQNLGQSVNKFRLLEEHKKIILLRLCEVFPQHVQYMHLFNVKDQEFLLQHAKKILKADFDAFLKHFQLYGLENQHLLRVLNLAMKQNSIAVLSSSYNDIQFPFAIDNSFFKNLISAALGESLIVLKHNSFLTILSKLKEINTSDDLIHFLKIFHLFYFKTTLNESKVTAFKQDILNFANGMGLDLAETINKVNTTHVSCKIVLSWIAQVLVVCAFDTLIVESWKVNRPIALRMLENGLNVHNPTLREKISSMGFVVMKNERPRRYFSDLMSNRSLSSNKNLFLYYLMASALVSRKINPVIISNDLIMKLKRNWKSVKCYKTRLSFFSFFHLCMFERTIKVSDIEFMIQQAFALPFSQIKSFLNNLLVLSHLGGPLLLRKRELTTFLSNFNNKFFEIFRSKIPVEIKPNFIDRFKEVFYDSRNPNAICTYAATLSKLSSPEKEQALEALAKFVNKVIDGKSVYRDWRYSTEDNIHLATIFKSYPELQAQWRKNIKKEFFLETVTPREAFCIRNYLDIALHTDKHFTLELVSEFIHTGKWTSPLEITPIIQAQELLIRSMQEDFTKLSLADQIQQINQIETLLGLTPDHPFVGDINAIRKGLMPNTLSGDLKIVFTDDPIDILLCGTDIEGSCQNVMSHAGNSKGLLGYLSDGKNKLIAIKNDTGKIVARALLRLVWDKTQKKPLLFLCRRYPQYIRSDEEKGIIEFAKSIADNLKLDLVTQDDKLSTIYPNAIFSLGGNSPFEYVDEANGMMMKGVYSLNKCMLLHSPAS